MASSQAEIAREISARIKRDGETRREAKREVDRIHKYLLRRTPGSTIENVGVHSMCKHTKDGEGPYATGALAKSIRTERMRERFGLPQWRIVSNHPNINMIEYGTGPDSPGSRSPWGPRTPTPEFGMFAQTAAHYGGTMP